MSKVWYGNLTNRLEEGKNFTKREIRVGDDITMYHWSDRDCYYVTRVYTPKRIGVKRYYICADKSKPGGMGHQDWVYFKTLREMHDYLGRDHFSDEEYAKADQEEVWVYRYKKWMREHIHTEMPHPEYCTQRERNEFAKYGEYTSYSNLSGRVSFGVRDYHYDWEF